MEIATAEGRFTADVAGPAGAPLVLLLHGFPQSRHSWREQVPALAAARYRVVAPDQRGYSPGVRPDPAAGLAAYSVDRLIADVLDLAAAEGHGAKPFHLVGHDWGGHVSWAVAHRHPERVASLTILSRPHPAAFRRAFRENADNQQHRSRHHKIFHDPATADLLLEDGGRRFKRNLANQGVGERRSRSTTRCWASARRSSRRWPGIARRARSRAPRWAQSRCPPCISGATRTPPLARARLNGRRST